MILVSYDSLIFAMHLHFLCRISLKHKCVRWLASKAACLLEGFPGARRLRSCSDETQSRGVAQQHVDQHTVAESMQSETGRWRNSINVVKATCMHVQYALINSAGTQQRFHSDHRKERQMQCGVYMGKSAALQDSNENHI